MAPGICALKGRPYTYVHPIFVGLSIKAKSLRVMFMLVHSCGWWPVSVLYIALITLDQSWILRGLIVRFGSAVSRSHKLGECHSIRRGRRFIVDVTGAQYRHVTGNVSWALRYVCSMWACPVKVIQVRMCRLYGDRHVIKVGRCLQTRRVCFRNQGCNKYRQEKGV